MDEPILTLPIVLQHLQVALIPWLIAALAGGGLGYGFARLARPWFYRHQYASRYLTLIPWRSVTVWLALVVIYSPWKDIQFGLGTFSASLALGAALGLLIFAWVAATSLRSWHPAMARETGLPTADALLWENLFSIFRLSAVLALALVVLLQAGLGYFLWRSSSTLDFPKMIQGYTVVGVMMIAADFILGLIQLTFVSPRLKALKP